MSWWPLGVCFIGILKRTDFGHSHSREDPRTTKPGSREHCVRALKNSEHWAAAWVPSHRFCPAGRPPVDTSALGAEGGAFAAGSQPCPDWTTRIFKLTRPLRNSEIPAPAARFGALKSLFFLGLWIVFAFNSPLERPGLGSPRGAGRLGLGSKSHLSQTFPSPAQEFASLVPAYHLVSLFSLPPSSCQKLSGSFIFLFMVFLLKPLTEALLVWFSVIVNASLPGA